MDAADQADEVMAEIKKNFPETLRDAEMWKERALRYHRLDRVGEALERFLRALESGKRIAVPLRYLDRILERLCEKKQSSASKDLDPRAWFGDESYVEFRDRTRQEGQEALMRERA